MIYSEHIYLYKDNLNKCLNLNYFYVFTIYFWSVTYSKTLPDI